MRLIPILLAACLLPWAIAVDPNAVSPDEVVRLLQNVYSELLHPRLVEHGPEGYGFESWQVDNGLDSGGQGVTAWNLASKRFHQPEDRQKIVQQHRPFFDHVVDQIDGTNDKTWKSPTFYPKGRYKRAAAYQLIKTGDVDQAKNLGKEYLNNVYWKLPARAFYANRLIHFAFSGQSDIYPELIPKTLKAITFDNPKLRQYFNVDSVSKRDNWSKGFQDPSDLRSKRVLELADEFKKHYNGLKSGLARSKFSQEANKAARQVMADVGDKEQIATKEQLEEAITEALKQRGYVGGDDKFVIPFPRAARQRAQALQGGRVDAPRGAAAQRPVALTIPGRNPAELGLRRSPRLQDMDKGKGKQAAGSSIGTGSSETPTIIPKRSGRQQFIDQHTVQQYQVPATSHREQTEPWQASYVPSPLALGSRRLDSSAAPSRTATSLPEAVPAGYLRDSGGAEDPGLRLSLRRSPRFQRTREEAPAVHIARWRSGRPAGPSAQALLPAAVLDDPGPEIPLELTLASTNTRRRARGSTLGRAYHRGAQSGQDLTLGGLYDQSSPTSAGELTLGGSYRGNAAPSDIGAGPSEQEAQAWSNVAPGEAAWTRSRYAADQARRQG